MTTPAPKGLSGVPLPMLEQLLAEVQRDRVRCPLTTAGLLDAGLKDLTLPVLAALGSVSKEGVVAALRIAIAERVHRPPPRLDLVWTGPEARGSTSRDTALVVEDLFAGAQRSVLVGGYRFDKPDILRPLHAAMVQRGVSAVLFLDIEGAAKTMDGVDAFATAAIDAFFHDVWTFGAPRPDVYFDPRTAAPGPPWATLHAKCIVVDDERTLITSANFTDRGQTRNIEAGVLIEGPAFAEELAAQWRQLIGAGLVTRYAG